MSVTPWLVATVVGLVTAHTAVNSLFLRRPPDKPAPVSVSEKVCVLLPVRDEAHHVRTCLNSLQAQCGVPQLKIVVLDDGSTDGTPEAVRDVSAGDPRVRLVTGRTPPPGWLGKTYACHQLAAHADPDAGVLIFVDADVVLAANAVAAALALLDRDVDLVCPYPRIIAVGPGERLVQPLLQWTWLTFLPLRAMERSRRPSLAAAGGQFLLIRRTAYERAGGHAAVRDQVLDDVALARAVKRSGGRIELADGSRIARCRMYARWSGVVDGYTKSLWASFRSPVAAAAVVGLLLFLYAMPVPVMIVAALLTAWTWAAAAATAYLLGVMSRVVSGRTTGARIWPDALAHPASIAVLAWLVIRSYRHRRRGELSWKGRHLDASATLSRTGPATLSRTGPATLSRTGPATLSRPRSPQAPLHG